MTISYNRLGSNGRHGNQMFQYAGFRGVAARNGYHWVIPPEDAPSTCNYSLFECFKMESVRPHNKGFGDGPTIDTGIFHFDEELYNNCPDNVNLNYYFQTEKYFKVIHEVIRRDYTFKDEILESSKEIIQQFGDCIFLHVRRGDYIPTPDHHPTQPIEYYSKALEKFDKDIPVLIFSDDLDWVRSQSLFQSDRFLLSENHVKYPNRVMLGDGSYQQSLVPYWDLCLMSLCKGGIIANSSMSWWGAWLQNGAGKIVAPDMWFGKAYAHYIMSDLLPESWETV